MFVLACGLIWSCLASGQFSPGELTTAHRDLEGLGNCTACHEIGAKISETRCLECHDVLADRIDAGRGFHAMPAVSQKECIDCHSEHHGRKFEMVRFDTTAFDHAAEAGWALEGAHSRTACSACHRPERIVDTRLAERKKTFLGLQTDCIGCHEDIHQGTLGPSCTDCHTQETFAGAELFDHADSDFPLRGAHGAVDCAQCHKPTVRRGVEFTPFADLAHANCTDCHEDHHDGAFGTRCTDCHSEKSWKQLKASNRFDHNLTAFPLEGLHAGVDCKACHKGGVTKSMPFARCTDCHDDYHEGEFVPRDCDACHSVQEPFTVADYGPAEHMESEFPLEGAHLATPCFVCHKPEAEERWSFRFDDLTCTACHDNVHEEAMTAAYWSPAEGGNCTDCHNEQTWAAVTFDHAETDWPLTGAHAEVDCRACHFPSKALADQIFADLSPACATCHEDQHGGQFAGSDGTTDCRSCHNPQNDWRADGFDHNTTDFPLEGRHAEIACADCHTPGAETLIYAIPSHECIDCHGQ